MSSWMPNAPAARRVRALLSGMVLCCASLLGTGARAAVDPSQLLPVDQVFVLSASAPSRDRIELHWKIADGYYLYRHRIGVQSIGDGFAADALQLPHGDKHHDDFFGDVETFRTQLTAVQPGTAASGASTATLRVKYQGCADAGVCYPPQTRTLTVALPGAAAARPAADAATGDASFAALGRALGAGAATPSGTLQAGMSAAQPLPAEQAFGFEAIVGDANTLLLRFTPAKGYYLYRDKTALRLSGGSGIALGQPRWPQGTLHRDEHFGNVVVYFDQVDVPLPLRRAASGPVEVTLTATFQGCQTGGICYPPMVRKVSLALPAAIAATTAAAAAPLAADGGADANAATAAPQPAVAAPTQAGKGAIAAVAGTPLLADTGQSEDSRLASGLAGSNRWLTLLGFFGAGLLLAFTPCVLPMIPILSGLIAGQRTRVGTGGALLLSLVYVVANALVFTAAGVVAGLLGANLQAAFQNPWIIAAFAALFVALALSSFGLFELQLPMGLRSRLGAITDRQRGGSLAGVAAMGALSALIVGPCVAPPLAGAVLYIGQSHDPVLGGAALFLLAMGMGMPLLAFGAAAGRGMPTSGPWMMTVQRVFGFLFLGLAIWMLSRIVPAVVALGLWGLLALAVAAWASTVATSTSRARWLARFAALVLAVVGAAQLLGALGGGSDPLQPLAGAFGSRLPATGLAFRTIKSSADLDREIAAAAAAGKPLMFDFYADWCVSCKEMEKYTFTDPSVHAALADFVLLKADVTANDATDQALMQRFGIIGPPATLFFGNGAEQRGLRLVGYEATAPFVARVRRVAR
ncbi:protein-disulfide reductase DsbD [Cognatiluteimonas profundi]|uniref:protein-disulfide reductase DsbD n=1 Tax=Cognatiluteimonas profundi TaxID=2594501 RepID=UPI00131B0698|nr:protein-disulfide reductase DsbD [Lysobacter profundi]